jgi:hypothetical protein
MVLVFHFFLPRVFFPQVSLFFLFSVRFFDFSLFSFLEVTRKKEREGTRKSGEILFLLVETDMILMCLFFSFFFYIIFDSPFYSILFYAMIYFFLYKYYVGPSEGRDRIRKKKQKQTYKK